MMDGFYSTNNLIKMQNKPKLHLFLVILALIQMKNKHKLPLFLVILAFHH